MKPYVAMPNSIRESIKNLGPWFHNLHLPGGVQTAAEHFLGDFPSCKWREFEAYIPAQLNGWRCLDIGCNAGFYSFELAKRGAKVLGIDSEPLYLKQAQWIAETFYTENRPEFRQMQIHDLAQLNEAFDLVLFMGVFYHLRYPSLALDTISRLVRKLMVFQTLTIDPIQRDFHPEIYSPNEDYEILDRTVFQEPGWPKLAFVEKKYSNDSTNWFIPNHAAVEAMLRSTGFERLDRVAHEIYFCYPPITGIEANRRWNSEEWISATGRRMYFKGN